MAEFNQYNLYSYAAGQMQSATDGKIFVDLQRFKSIHKMDELNDYIDKTFGDFDDEKIYRLLGVGLYNLCKEEIKKEDIFTYQSIEEKKEKIQNMLDDMNKKYGTDVIKFYKK